MQQPEEPAPEPEAQRGARLHLIFEARIVETQTPHRLSQILEIVRIHREETAEHDRLLRLEARQRLFAGTLFLRHRVADTGMRHFLDRGREIADLARIQRGDRLLLGLEDTHLIDGVAATGLHQPDALALLHLAVDDTHQHNDAEIGVVPAIDQHRFQRRLGVALGRRQAVHDRLQHILDAETAFRRNLEGFGGVEADHFLDLLARALRLGGWQVDLVQHGHDLVVHLDRLIDIGERLGFHALAGIDHEERPLAGRQRPVHLIGEVHMAGRVDEVQLIGLAILGRVIEADRLGLDGNAALALDIHVIEHLLLHLAHGQAAA